MALFGNKKSDKKSLLTQAAADAFNDDFQEELRSSGREYFQRLLQENDQLFHKDLEAVVAYVNTELKQHVNKQISDELVGIVKDNQDLKATLEKHINEQFTDYSKTITGANTLATKSMLAITKSFQDHQTRTDDLLEKALNEQKEVLAKVTAANQARLDAIKTEQDGAIHTLAQTVEQLKIQQEQLGASLKASVEAQEKQLVAGFEDNMARIIENYLLTALGDQYDLKAQLPAILKQMDAQKDAIAEDIRL